MKVNTQKIIFVVIVYLIYIHFFKGYNSYLPSIPIYPNNEKDLELLKKQITNRNHEDINLFFKTNISVVPAFKPYVSESNEELEKIATSQNLIILFFKYLINRRRPYQIDENLNPLSTLTSQTPAYPAGHAYQAILLASRLSEKYPDKKDLFNKIALDCDKCRVRAGIHYVSDGEFSRTLFKIFN
mgnify:FL=1|tara:strand:+ start:93 stop:647 length:555 start_codon:yes stop_codon:yes gene_type:complete